jgi:hypothetical protein
LELIEVDAGVDLLSALGLAYLLCGSRAGSPPAEFVSGLLSTKLTFVVAVVQVASANDSLRPATATALITAGSP